MNKWLYLFILLVLAVVVVYQRGDLGCSQPFSPGETGGTAPEIGQSQQDIRQGEVNLSDLPVEVRDTLQLIKKGGPYPHSKDGTVFYNRESQLPAKSQGYYHEYTVKTPGSTDRGARRIVAGQKAEYYYTDDHYRTFRRIVE